MYTRRNLFAIETYFSLDNLSSELATEKSNLDVFFFIGSWSIDRKWQPSI